MSGANGHDDLGRVHTHQEKFRPLPFDIEREKSRRRRWLAWCALGVAAAFGLWLLVEALR